MDHPKPLSQAFPGPKSPMIALPDVPRVKDGRGVPKSTHLNSYQQKLPDEKPTVFRKGFIPTKLPPEHTSDRCELIYNTLKGLILIGHNRKRPNKEKMKAGFKEIRAENPELYDRVKTYYDRLNDEQIAFFIGPRPAYMDDGKLAIWDHNRDNPVLQAVLKGEKPKDVDPRTLKPKSKLVLPSSLGGIIGG